MDDALTANRQGSIGRLAREAAQSASHRLPLSFLGAGETGSIANVRGRGDMHHHLETLGFVEGAQVSVVSEAAGNLIVEVKGTQVALDRQVATRIVVNVHAR